jgi:HSP20 family protein
MASGARWDPFREIASLQSELGRLLNVVGESARGQAWMPPADAWETDRELVFAFELAGIPEGDISIELEQGTLTVSGERRPPEVPAERLHRLERRYGPFSRSVSVPAAVADEQISAHYKDGVLEIRIAKPEAPKPRKIEIGGKNQ